MDKRTGNGYLISDERRKKNKGIAYFGIGRVFPFLKAVNAVLEEKGVPLPLKDRR